MQPILRQSPFPPFCLAEHSGFVILWFVLVFSFPEPPIFTDNIHDNGWNADQGSRFVLFFFFFFQAIKFPPFFAEPVLRQRSFLDGFLSLCFVFFLLVILCDSDCCSFHL